MALNLNLATVGSFVPVTPIILAVLQLGHCDKPADDGHV
jgi:hypothetical protein